MSVVSSRPGPFVVVDAGETDPCCGPLAENRFNRINAVEIRSAAEWWNVMNKIIYIVGLVVIVLFVLGFLGLR